MHVEPVSLLLFISSLGWFNFMYIEVTDTENRVSNCNSILPFRFAVYLNNWHAKFVSQLSVSS